MSLANRYDKNIFCLEGDWETDLRKKSSVQSALQLLEANLDIDTIYKTCSTYEEFCNRIFTLTNDKRIYSKYSIIYLAFHGRKNKIQIGDDHYTLDQIGNQFENIYRIRFYILGVVKPYSSMKKRLKNFYKKLVHWLFLDMLRISILFQVLCLIFCISRCARITLTWKL